ncbi:MAG: DNA cytosine methyltransferase, partial [Victivallis vadensis]
MNEFRFVDLFCGGGGSITGAINALRAAGESYEGRGFNHWETAIKTIQANHPEIVPDFNRACAPIESILPDEIFQDDPTRIDVLWASPSCTHHSVAAGGKPRSNQLRSQPEYLLPYLRLTRCRRMFVENVKELRDWGPILDKDTTHKGRLYKAGTADPRKKGVFFN